MGNVKELTVKNFKETLVNYSSSNEELEKIYRVFYEMAFMGFVPMETWKEFSDEVRGWYYYEDLTSCEIRDRENGDAVIYDYNRSDEPYKA